jgi:hypothetical protein
MRVFFTGLTRAVTACVFAAAQLPEVTGRWEVTTAYFRTG